MHGKIKISGNPFICLIAFLFFLMFASFCSQKERTGREGLSILPDKEEFIIKEKEKNGSSDSRGNKKIPGVKDPFKLIQNKKIDFIWVLDNSTSMSSHQENLKNSAQYFFRLLESYNYDFRIAVITTDLYETKRLKYFRQRAGTIFHTQYKGIPFLTSDTPNLQELFTQNIMVSTRHSNDERGMESLMVALETAEGKSFLREDAFLSVIFISDEEDGSLGLKGNKDLSPEEKSQRYLAHYLPLLKEIKGSREDPQVQGVSISSVVIMNKECKNTLKGYVEIGSLYIDIAKATSGISHSLCHNSFDDIMEDSARIVVSQTRYFKLKRIPEASSLQVSINGIIKTQEEEWKYDREKNSIFFLHHITPSKGDRVTIDYTPTNLIL